MGQSSHDTIYVQEVEKLEKQKNEAKDEEGRKVIEKKIAIKSLESDLANVKDGKSKKLNFTTDVVCHEVVIGSVQWVACPQGNPVFNVTLSQRVTLKSGCGLGTTA